MSQHCERHLNLVQHERGNFTSGRGIVSTEHEDELQREALAQEGDKSKKRCDYVSDEN